MAGVQGSKETNRKGARDRAKEELQARTASTSGGRQGSGRELAESQDQRSDTH